MLKVVVYPDAVLEDPESSDVWLERLYALNAAVAGSQEPVAGNIFYEHHQSDYLTSPPVAANRAKRDRFRRACHGRRHLLEIGVNGGHSAYLALTTDPSLHFTGVDICEHAYVHAAVEWLQAEFPGRVTFHEGSCLTVLPRLARRGLQFDLFHVDGGKHTYYRDVLNAHRLKSPGVSLLVMDDVNLGGVGRTWERCLREGLLEAVTAFPSMAADEVHRNEIGLLPQIPERRLLLLRARTSGREFRRRSRRRIGL